MKNRFDSTIERMINMKCRNCGVELTEKICPECGYDMDIQKPFLNEITNRELKEQVADAALTLLINQNLIHKERDLKHLVVKFGYLLVPEDTENVVALLKVIPPKKMFQKNKVFCLGMQEGQLMLLGAQFNEAMFEKVTHDMLLMHKVDISKENPKDYVMELY